MSDAPGPKTSGARNLKIVVEYDGRDFHGWQRQPGGLRTVQGELERGAAILCGHPVTMRGSGRTDAGVHAWGQVANFHILAAHSNNRILRGLNGLCDRDVRVIAVEEVHADWEARACARGKWYRYRLLPRLGGPALERGRVWHLPPTLDLDRMRAELATLPATAHWGAYRASDCTSPDPVKTLSRAELEEEPRGVVAVRFCGSGFLKQMVRILVGTLVDVGRGRLPPGSMVRIREGGERREAGPTAPPQGLFLERVLYDSQAQNDEGPAARGRRGERSGSVEES